MTRFASALFAAALALTGAAQGKAVLPLAGFDASQILPPPPAPGSPRASGEIDELKTIAATRTPDAFDAAARDGDEQTGAFFQSAIGPGFDLGKLPATKHLLADIADSDDVFTGPAKKYFARARPWIVIDGLKTCSFTGVGPAHNSYPSGHSTLAYSMAGVLAALLPAKAQPILARAAQYAENRLVCGMHFRSDIVAGQVLGTLIAQRLLADPAFRTEFDAAAAELAAAHLRE